jgi:hypothetical protein
MVNVLVTSRGVIVGVAVNATPQDCLEDAELGRSVRLRAIEAIKDTDADDLKESFLRGLIDAEAYPHDFTEIM